MQERIQRAVESKKRNRAAAIAARQPVSIYQKPGQLMLIELAKKVRRAAQAPKLLSPPAQREGPVQMRLFG